MVIKHYHNHRREKPCLRTDHDRAKSLKDQAVSGTALCTYLHHSTNLAWEGAWSWRANQGENQREGRWDVHLGNCAWPILSSPECQKPARRSQARNAASRYTSNFVYPHLPVPAHANSFHRRIQTCLEPEGTTLRCAEQLLAELEVMASELLRQETFSAPISISAQTAGWLLEPSEHTYGVSARCACHHRCWRRTLAAHLAPDALASFAVFLVFRAPAHTGEYRLEKNAVTGVRKCEQARKDTP